MTDQSALELLMRAHEVRAPRTSQSSDLAWVKTNAQHEERNLVLWSTTEHIDEANAVFGEVPALWHSWPNHSEYNIERKLEERGFLFVEEEPVMVVDLIRPWFDGGYAVTQERTTLNTSCLPRNIYQKYVNELPGWLSRP
ncbi:hypothetical protein, partial [Brevibacterium sp. FAM 24630]|uniref:hypothetical protein n=1 Tax=Brevibacterium sp. FAM 24630 TaxID=3415680 RepID=UPI003C7A5154